VEGLVMLPDAAFWRGKRVLLTGHTGFKGAWMAVWLQRLGAQVTGFSLAPPSSPSLFERADIAHTLDSRQGDIRDAMALQALVSQVRPQLVLHFAAQSLVRQSYRQPLETYATNMMGTANLLEAVRIAGGVRAVLVVTTDKVYRNRDWSYPYREDDALGGHDPYSASKAAAELVAASYRDAFLARDGCAVATVRAGNVIGGGDWAQDRLLPDAYRAWSSHAVLQIRRPDAVRPWQHVLEPLAAYMRLAHVLWDDPARAGAFNFGPATNEAVSVRELVTWAQDAFGGGQCDFAQSVEGVYESATLSLETAHARQVLGVTPCWSVRRAVRQTMAWYRRFQSGSAARDLCLADLADYEGSHAALGAH